MNCWLQVHRFFFMLLLAAAAVAFARTKQFVIKKEASKQASKPAARTTNYTETKTP